MNFGRPGFLADLSGPSRSLAGFGSLRGSSTAGRCNNPMAIGTSQRFLKRVGDSSAEGTEMMVAYLREIGLTPPQINYMIRTPQPEIQLAMEWHARALGFHYQQVPSLFGSWQTCQAKYCLAVP
jgi:hypothetical protein